MMMRRTIAIDEDEIDALEAHLAGALKPVAPPQDIIQRLRSRINFPAREQIALRLHDWRTLFFVFGGVMSGLLLLVTLARALYYFAGRRDAM